jgi:hypothetical protein
MNKAYRTEYKGVVSYVAATNHTDARLITSLAIKDAWDEKAWIAIKVHRAPEYDHWAAITKHRQTTGPEDMPKPQLPEPKPGKNRTYRSRNYLRIIGDTINLQFNAEGHEHIEICTYIGNTYLGVTLNQEEAEQVKKWIECWLADGGD